MITLTLTTTLRNGARYETTQRIKTLAGVQKIYDNLPDKSDVIKSVSAEYRSNSKSRIIEAWEKKFAEK